MTRIQKRRATQRRNKKLKTIGMNCLFGFQALVVSAVFISWAFAYNA